MLGASGLCKPQEYVHIDEETYGCDWVLEAPQPRERAASVMPICRIQPSAFDTVFNDVDGVFHFSRPTKVAFHCFSDRGLHERIRARVLREAAPL